MTCAVVFTYNRPEMLLNTVQHLLKHVDRIIVVDDGSPVQIGLVRDNIQYMHLPHVGKEGWWKHWDRVFKVCKDVDCDRFIFMPDDFENLDVSRALSLYDSIKGDAKTLNLINCGREQWGATRVQVSDDLILCGFNDCGFVCSKFILRRLKFRMFPIYNYAHESSGVGRQLTSRLRKINVAMYCPVRSLAHHGDHPSVMHPELRKREPIISK